jgi:PKD repeat protein
VTVALTAPATVTTLAPAEFSASVTTVPAGAIVERYEWDFGDGSGRTTSSNATSHLYSAGGGRRYVVTVRAVTTTGASGTAQREIVVQ